MQAELERIRDWAKKKIQGGSEPPWAWYQYMKLIETADAILEGMASTNTRPHLKLVGDDNPDDTAVGHSKPQMPM